MKVEPPQDEDEDDYGEDFDSYDEEEFEMEDPTPTSPTVVTHTPHLASTRWAA